jgi:hypothetical protein
MLRVGEFDITPSYGNALGDGFWINLNTGPREGEGMWISEEELEDLIGKFFRDNF